MKEVPADPIAGVSYWPYRIPLRPIEGKPETKSESLSKILASAHSQDRIRSAIVAHRKS